MHIIFKLLFKKIFCPHFHLTFYENITNPFLNFKIYIVKLKN